MLGKLLFLFISLSFRSSYLPDIPFDYEIKGGFESERCQASILRERENGGLYWGVNYKQVFPDLYLKDVRLQAETEWYCRTAKDINYQSVKMLYPINTETVDCYVGLSVNADNWDNPKPLLSFKAKMGTLQYGLETNFYDRDIVSLEFGKRFMAERGVYFKPLLVYRSINGAVFWQAKMEIGIDFTP